MTSKELMEMAKKETGSRTYEELSKLLYLSPAYTYALRSTKERLSLETRQRICQLCPLIDPETILFAD